MRSDTAGDDIRELLRLVADEVPQENTVPPGALRRARKRLLRNSVIVVAVLAVAVLGTLGSVEALQGVGRTTPAVNPTHSTIPDQNGRIAVTTPGGSVEGPDHVFSYINYLYAVAPDGSDPRLLADIQTEYPDWSPDGSTIAFDNGMVLQTEGLCVLCWQTARGHIFTVKADGTELTQVTSGNGAEFAPDWSPDGAHLAIAAREGQGSSVRISILDLTTGEMQAVTAPPAGYVDTEPDYSPDGTQIVFARGDVSNYRLALFVVNLDGTGLRQLTPWELNANAPSWSPDGSTIVFQNDANCCEDPLSEIYSIGADGTGLILLSTPPTPSLQASPGSRRLPDVPRETARAASMWPSWSPDGARIVFVRRIVAESSPLELFTMNPDGTDVTPIRLSGLGEDWRDPAWGTHS